MKVNYHTHTRRCLHAGGSEEDYVRAALEAGVAILGFSDHAPFPDRDYGYRMPYGELEAYFAEVDRLTEVYSPEVTILRALEIEYLPQYRDYYERLLGEHRVDYLLLGEHFFAGGGGLLNITQARDTADCVAYARAAAEGMRAGYFRMLAHPDIYAMNCLPWDRNCEAAADILLDAAAETGTVLEFNANGFRRGIHDYPEGPRYMYPHPAFWRRVRGTGLPVAVGSDCHGPEQLWDDSMERAHRALAELGIVPLEVLEPKD